MEMRRQAACTLAPHQGSRSSAALAQGQPAFTQVTDPGVRKAATDGGEPLYLPGLTDKELMFYRDGLPRFKEVDGVCTR